MTTARTEPTDGFLDREFASFREARLRARKAKTEDALEHRHAKVAEPAPAPATSAEPGSSPAQDDAFFGTSTHERTSIRARARDDRSTAMLEVMLDDLDGDVAATRTGPRVDAPPTPPEVVAAPPTLAPAPPPRADDDGTRAMGRAGAAAEDSCSDPEFEAFRAARRGGKPDSGRLRKPDGRPESGRLRKPEPRRADAAVEGHCSDPEFERFRAARQAGEATAPRRADSGRLRKPEPPPSAIEQLLAVTLPEPAGSPEATTPAPTEDPAPVESSAPEEPTTVFFGTSKHERAIVRARVAGESPDPDEPATGRRAPPPPLPERPSA